MIKIEKMSDFDRITFVAVILLFVYWIVVKIPLVFTYGIYQATWIFGILAAFISPIYFLIRWAIAKFSFKKIYFYALLISLFTLLIMLFVFSISFSGVEITNAEGWWSLFFGN